MEKQLQLLCLLVASVSALTIPGKPQINPNDESLDIGALDPKYGSKEEGMIHDMYNDAAEQFSKTFKADDYKDAQKEEGTVPKKRINLDTLQNNPAGYAKASIKVAHQKGITDNWALLQTLVVAYKQRFVELNEAKKKTGVVEDELEKVRDSVRGFGRMRASMTSMITKSNAVESSIKNRAEAAKKMALAQVSLVETGDPMKAMKSKEEINFKFNQQLQLAATEKSRTFEEMKQQFHIPSEIDFKTATFLVSDDGEADSDVRRAVAVQAAVKDELLKIEMQQEKEYSDLQERLALDKKGATDEIERYKAEAEGMKSQAFSSMQSTLDAATAARRRSSNHIYSTAHLSTLNLIQGGDEKPPTDEEQVEKLKGNLEKQVGDKKKEVAMEMKKMAEETNQETSKEDKELNRLKKTKEKLLQLQGRLNQDLQNVRMFSTMVSKPDDVKIEKVDKNIYSFADDMVGPLDSDKETTNKHEGKSVAEVIKKMENTKDEFNSQTETVKIAAPAPKKEPAANTEPEVPKSH